MPDFPIFEDLLIDYGMNFSKIISMEGHIHRRSKTYPHKLSKESFNPWKVNP